MLQVKVGTQYFLPVRLLDSTNAPVTGKTYSSITATAYYENGSSVGTSPASGSDWLELASGAYLLKFTAAHNTTIGALTLVVSTSGANDYVGVYDIVTNLASDIQTNIGTAPGGGNLTSVYGVLGTPSHNMTGLAGDIAAISGGGGVPIPMTFSGTFKGSTNPAIFVRILNATTSAPITGLTGGSAGLVVAAVDPTGSASAITSVTLTEITTGAFSGQGIYQLSGTGKVPTTVEGQWTLTVGYTGAANYVTTYIVSNELWDDIYTRIGAPHGASIAADINAAGSQTGTIGGDTNYIYNHISGGGTSYINSQAQGVEQILGSTFSLFFRLVTSAGVPVTGKVQADISTVVCDGAGTEGTVTFPGGSISELTVAGFSGTGTYIAKNCVISTVIGPSTWAFSCAGAVTYVTTVNIIANTIGSIFTDTTNIVSTLGTPHITIADDIGAASTVNGSVGGDTAATLGLVGTVITTLGTPNITIADDIGAVASVNGSIGGDTAAILGRIGTAPGGSYTTLFKVLGTPAAPTTGLAGDIAAISGSIAGNFPKTQSSNLQFALNQNFNLVIQMLSSSGTPVSGITHSAITVTMVDPLGSPSTISVTAPNWIEVGGPYAGAGVYVLKNLNVSTGIGNALFTFQASGAVNTNLLVNIVRYQPYDTYTGIQTILGMPAGASVSADIAAVYASTGAGLSTTVGNIYTSVGAALATAVAGVQTTANNIYSRIGAPVGASISADIASTHAAVTAQAADITKIRKIEGNRWKIITTGPGANTMVVYDDDGVTPYITFNLFDSAGVPTFVNPYERAP